MTKDRRVRTLSAIAIAGALAGACSSQTGAHADQMLQSAGNMAQSAGQDTVNNFQGIGRDVGDATASAGNAISEAATPDEPREPIPPARPRTVALDATDAQANRAVERADREAERLEREAQRALRRARDARIRAEDVRFDAEHRVYDPD